VFVKQYSLEFHPNGEYQECGLAEHRHARGVVIGPSVVPAFAAFLQAPMPQGVGMACAVLDQFTYAIIEVSGTNRTATITPKNAAGRPVCRAPLVITAAP
jgi:hypothetical protein